MTRTRGTQGERRQEESVGLHFLQQQLWEYFLTAEHEITSSGLIGLKEREREDGESQEREGQERHTEKESDRLLKNRVYR